MYMRKFAGTFVFLLAITSVFGQLSDDFTDGNLTAAPVWEGDTGKFTVADGKLQLNDMGAASSNQALLYTTALTGPDADTEWRINVTMDFSPSASNFARLYLNAAGTNFAADDSYILKIGGISGSEDAVELLVRENGQLRTILSGTPGAVANGPVSVRIRVTRSRDGTWELWADYNGGMDFQSEGSANDLTLTGGSYFALECLYTSTRSTSFTFDDLFIDPILEDDTAPVLLGAEAIDTRTVRLQFDEPLAASSWPNSDFSIDQGIGNPQSVLPVAGAPAILELQLSSDLQPGVDYTATVSGIQDLVGNTATDQSVNFLYLPVETAGFQDIIFSEVYADPSPSLGLPEFEFVELYNRSSKFFDLGQLQFSSGGTPQNIESQVLAPGAYVIICDEEAAEAFANFGEVGRIGRFPSLTNAGDDLSLQNKDGMEISSLSYELSWYKDADKESGGYSLELVDPLADPECSGNWYGSKATLGGTPGAPNSWLGEMPDQAGPVLLRAFAESSFEAIMNFDEPLSFADIKPENFLISGGLTIISAQPVADDANRVLLTFDREFAGGTRYQITVLNNIADCLGNRPPDDQVVAFGIAETPAPLDLVINEILFHPQSGGEDFVEIYNRSGKIINLRDLQLLNTAKESGNRSQTIATDYLVFPGEFAVITDVPADILDRYTTGGLNLFIEQDLPTLDAASGNLTLQFAGVQIDVFDYEDSYHFPLLRDERGVSLERIDTELPTQDPDNWQSAASTVGFATPGLPNSQARGTAVGPSPISGIITLNEKTLSPDGDGFQDVLIIEYETPGPGYLLNANIFDLEGRRISVLANNELLAARGSLKWDGTTSDRSKARIGIYLIWFEIFDAEGNVMTAKEPIVVAGQLE